MSDTTETEIRPYYPVELARMYGVSKCTMLRWLKPHQRAVGEKIGKYYTALQVRTIFHILGSPGSTDDGD
jgi:hypothetical protein